MTGVSLTGDGSHSHNIEGLHTHESKEVIETVTPGTTTIPHVTGATSTSGGSHSHPISVSSGTIASVSGTVLTLRTEAITYIAGNTDDAGSHSHDITISSTNKSVVSSVTTTKVNVANPGSATILATLEATHTHSVSASTLSETFMTGGTISSETPIATVEGVKYTPTGSVSVSVGEHRHTYNAPIAHTHKISGFDRIEETFDLKAYILDHSHTVTIPKHSHNVNEHSHVVKLK